MAAALTLSLLLHLLPFLPTDFFAAKKPSTAAILQASLRPPPQPVLATPEMQHEEKPRATAPTRPTPTAGARPPAQNWLQSVRQQFRKLDAQGLFYPAEAISRGLQGEVLVLFYVDENGTVTAARVEQGSGHPVLDEAALRAVRSLRGLPADTPKEGLLPVSFRLH